MCELPVGKNFHGGSLTMGSFDGFHLGHQSLLQQVKAGPRPWVVITFDPHPIRVLSPEVPFARLFPSDDLEHVLAPLGVDLLLKVPFTKELARLSPDDFAIRFFESSLAPKRLVVGYDFAFGRDRKGDLAWMTQWGKNHGCEVLSSAPIEYNGRVISSRWLRELIGQGEVEIAHRLLGRPFYVRGVVESGAGLGRTIGSPTLNLRWEGETRPVDGVYSTRVRWQGKTFLSVTNIGIRPTVSSSSALHIETHLLDENRDLYGQVLEIDFIRFQRPEIKFNSIEDLRNQIQLDILKARQDLGS